METLKHLLPSAILACIFALIGFVVYGIFRFIDSFSPKPPQLPPEEQEEKDIMEHIAWLREEHKKWRLADEEIEGTNQLIEEWGGEKLE